MILTIKGVTSVWGLPTDSGVQLRDYQIDTAKATNAYPAPVWVKGTGGRLMVDGDAVTIDNTKIFSGSEGFELEPLTEARVHAHGVDARIALGLKPSLAIKG
jgi:hypothetical protein